MDLSNEEDEVAKYMSENHSEIKRILCGEHEKYKFYGVVIKADGRIELAFSIDGMLNIDKIPVVLDNNPCFTVETDEVLQRYVTITVTPVQGRHMTVITESQLGMTYRHINTGWQNQKTVAYYENIE